MDSLLELLEQYRCHLIRGSLSMKDFLNENFDSYINDLKRAVYPKDNPLTGTVMCDMVVAMIDKITENAQRLVEVFDLYEKGKIVTASLKAFEVFKSMKPQLMQRYSGAYQHENYYRIRDRSDHQFPLERKELFHIPHNKNYLVGTERYSMPGHPCLYLASQPELCWYECGRPEKFAITKFDIPQEENCNLKFVDFSEKLMPLKYSFFSWFHNEEDIVYVRKYLLKYICTYPLRAACSVIVEHPGSRFIEEYIVPQLLLQWVLSDSDFDGIRYESCSPSDDVKAMGGHNLVLVTNNFDTDGYDTKLRGCIKIGEPALFDIDSITADAHLLDLLDGKELKDDPFFWNMESISADYQLV